LAAAWVVSLHDNGLPLKARLVAGVRRRLRCRQHDFYALSHQLAKDVVVPHPQASHVIILERAPTSHWVGPGVPQRLGRWPRFRWQPPRTQTSPALQRVPALGVWPGRPRLQTSAHSCCTHACHDRLMTGWTQSVQSAWQTMPRVPSTPPSRQLGISLGGDRTPATAPSQHLC